MAVIATLAVTPIPASATIGGIPQMLYHGTITSAGGAGTYLVTHNLAYKPTFVHVIAQLADAVAPTAANSCVARCVADDTASAFGVNLPASGTFEVIFG